MLVRYAGHQAPPRSPVPSVLVVQGFTETDYRKGLLMISFHYLGYRVTIALAKVQPVDGSPIYALTKVKSVDGSPWYKVQSADGSPRYKAFYDPPIPLSFQPIPRWGSFDACLDLAQCAVRTYADYNL